MTNLPSSYHHTQKGYGMLVMLAVGLVITAGVAVLNVRIMPPGSSRTVALSIDAAVAFLVLAAATIFSITMRDGQRFSFGTNEPDRLAAAIAPVSR